MDLSIRLESPVTPEIAADLDALADMLTRELDLPVQKTRIPAAKGSKDGGLIIAISVLGVLLTGANTALNLINFWRSRNNRYSISIKRDGIQQSIAALSPTEFRALLRELDEAKAALELSVSA